MRSASRWAGDRTRRLLVVVALIAVGTAAFSGLGLLLGGTLSAAPRPCRRQPGVVPAAPARRHGVPAVQYGGAEGLLQLLPTAALSHGLRDLLQHGSFVAATSSSWRWAVVPLPPQQRRSDGSDHPRRRPPACRGGRPCRRTPDRGLQPRLHVAPTSAVDAAARRSARRAPGWCSPRPARPWHSAGGHWRHATSSQLGQDAERPGRHCPRGPSSWSATRWAAWLLSWARGSRPRSAPASSAPFLSTSAGDLVSTGPASSPYASGLHLLGGLLRPVAAGRPPVLESFHRPTATLGRRWIKPAHGDADDPELVSSCRKCSSTRRSRPPRRSIRRSSPTTSAALPVLRIPTTVLCGTSDRLTPHPHSEAMAAALGSSAIMLVPTPGTASTSAAPRSSTRRPAAAATLSPTGQWHDRRQARALRAQAALALQVLLVVSHGGRVTGSGLGCPTWPQCTGGSLTNTAALEGGTATSSSATAWSPWHGSWWASPCFVAVVRIGAPEVWRAGSRSSRRWWCVAGRHQPARAPAGLNPYVLILHFLTSFPLIVGAAHCSSASPARGPHRYDPGATRVLTECVWPPPRWSSSWSSIPRRSLASWLFMMIVPAIGVNIPENCRLRPKGKCT